MTYAFAAANLLTLAVLLYRRYYRIFPIFCGALAASTWQAGVVSLMRPGWSRGVWFPGEVVAVAMAAAAALEAGWCAVRRLEIQDRLLILGGLAMVATGLTVESRPNLAPADWYITFLDARSWVYLGLAILAVCSLWVGWWVRMYRDRHWARAARMHMALFATLMGAHAIFGGMVNWSGNRASYRLLASLCLAGWLVNSNFLAREREASRRFLDGFRQSLAPAHQSFSQERHSVTQGD